MWACAQIHQNCGAWPFLSVVVEDRVGIALVVRHQWDVYVDVGALVGCPHVSASGGCGRHPNAVWWVVQLLRR